MGAGGSASPRKRNNELEYEEEKGLLENTSSVQENKSEAKRVSVMEGNSSSVVIVGPKSDEIAQPSGVSSVGNSQYSAAPAPQKPTLGRSLSMRMSRVGSRRESKREGEPRSISPMRKFSKKLTMKTLGMMRARNPFGNQGDEESDDDGDAEDEGDEKTPPLELAIAAKEEWAKPFFREACETQKVVVSAVTHKSYFPAAEEGKMLAMASIHAPFMAASNVQRFFGADIVAVVDRSGSMQDGKLLLVKETLDFMIKQLQPQDRLSVVSFNDKTSVDFPLAHVTDENRGELELAINQMQGSGTTNLSGGLLSGMKQIRENESMNDISAVLLFTDGIANKGILSTNKLNDRVKRVLSQIDTTCCLFTFGYGTQHDPEMLDTVAATSGGVYYRILDPEAIPGAFSDCLGGILSMAAKNIRVGLTPLNGAQLLKVLTKFPLHGGAADATDLPEPSNHTNTRRESRITADEVARLAAEEEALQQAFPRTAPVWVEVRDIYSEERRDVPLMLKLPALRGGEAAEAQAVLKVTLMYTNTATNTNEKHEQLCMLRRPPPVSTAAAAAAAAGAGDGDEEQQQQQQQQQQQPENEEVNYTVVAQQNRFIAADAMMKATELGQKMEFVVAQELLQAARRVVQGSGVPEEESEPLLHDLQMCIQGLLNQESFMADGLATLRGTMTAHFTQRSNSTVRGYTTRHKDQMVRDFNNSIRASARAEKYQKVVEDLRKKEAFLAANPQPRQTLAEQMGFVSKASAGGAGSGGPHGGLKRSQSMSPAQLKPSKTPVETEAEREERRKTFMEHVDQNGANALFRGPSKRFSKHVAGAASARRATGTSAPTSGR